MAPTDGRPPVPEHTDRTTRPRAASLSPTNGASSLAPPKKRRCYRLSPVEILDVSPPSSAEVLDVAPPSPVEILDVTPPSPVDSMDSFVSVTPPASIDPFISVTRSPMDGLLLYPDSITPVEGFDSVTPPSSAKAVGSTTPPILRKVFSPIATPPILRKVFSPITPPCYSHVLSSVSPNESSSIDCLQEHTDLSVVPPRKTKCCIGTPDESTSSEHQRGPSSDARVQLWEVQKPVSDENSGLSFILRRTHLGEGTKKGSRKRLMSEISTDNTADKDKRRAVYKEVSNVSCDDVSRCPSFPGRKTQV